MRWYVDNNLCSCFFLTPILAAIGIVKFICFSWIYVPIVTVIGFCNHVLQYPRAIAFTFHRIYQTAYIGPNLKFLACLLSIVTILSAWLFALMMVFLASLVVCFATLMWYTFDDEDSAFVLIDGLSRLREPGANIVKAAGDIEWYKSKVVTWIDPHNVEMGGVAPPGGVLPPPIDISWLNMLLCMFVGLSCGLTTLLLVFAMGIFYVVFLEITVLFRIFIVSYFTYDSSDRCFGGSWYAYLITRTAGLCIFIPVLLIVAVVIAFASIALWPLYASVKTICGSGYECYINGVSAGVNQAKTLVLEQNKLVSSFLKDAWRDRV